MTRREFTIDALKNGYTGRLCEGWDWIRANLTALDYIFQTPEYKAANHYVGACMAILTAGDTFSMEETRVLNTAWYLNNAREDRQEKDEYAKKMIAEGWLPLTDGLMQEALDNGQNIRIGGVITHDWLTHRSEKILKPVKSSDGTFFLLPPRARRRGYGMNQFENAFVKLVGRGEGRRKYAKRNK